MELDGKLVRVLFDTAAHSMDFGSGFLDDEEVSALREVAAALGVDPMEGTPRNFRCKYRGAHQANAKPSGEPWVFDYGDGRVMTCTDCGRQWPADQAPPSVADSS